VKEILKTGANDVYVVQGSKGEILLPAIPQVIREVRLEEGRMVVRLMEGLA
jgi:16S rRNA processing protein RimM